MAKKKTNLLPPEEPPIEELEPTPLLQEYVDDEIEELDEEEANALLPNLSREEAMEEKKLQWKEILGLVVIGFFAFLFFILLTFPLNETVRSILFAVSRESGIGIDAKEIDFSLLGDKTFDSLVIQLPTGTLFKTDQLLLQLGLIALWNSKLEGSAMLHFWKWESLEFSLQGKESSWVVQLTGLEEKPTKWVGDLDFDWKDTKILESPEFPLLGNLDNREIKRIQLSLKIRSGKAIIEKGILESSLARMQLSGSIRIMENLATSPLDTKLCFILTDAFQKERPDLAGMMTLLPQENGRVCIPIRGTLQSPKPEIPQNAFSGSTNSP